MDDNTQWEEKLSDWIKQNNLDEEKVKKAVEGHTGDMDFLKNLKKEDFAKSQPEQEKPEEKEDDKDKDKDKSDDYKSNGDEYKGRQNPDGSCTMTGPDGKTKNYPDFESMNDDVCSTLKNKALAENKEPKISFKSSPRDEEHIQTFCRNAIMKHGVTIAPDADFVNDPQFWKDLKQEYLKQGHKESDWNKMTRFVPDEAMGRTPEERQTNNSMIKYMETKERLNKKKENGKEDPAPTKTSQAEKDPLLVSKTQDKDIGNKAPAPNAPQTMNPLLAAKLRNKSQGK